MRNLTEDAACLEINPSSSEFRGVSCEPVRWLCSLVQKRTRMMNQLHVVALNEGLRRKKALWRLVGRKRLESLQLSLSASRRREDLADYPFAQLQTSCSSAADHTFRQQSA